MNENIEFKKITRITIGAYVAVRLVNEEVIRGCLSFENAVGLEIAAKKGDEETRVFVPWTTVLTLAESDPNKKTNYSFG